MVNIHPCAIQGFVVFVITCVYLVDCIRGVDSKYLPLMPPPSNPYPFATSLYRAPQTYDRGKTMSMPRNPYILISKVRPCYVDQENAGRHFHKHQRPNNYDTLSPPRVKFTGTHVHLVPPFQQLGSPQVTEEFSGSWAITKPDEEHAHDENDNLSNNGVTYYEDGTRVVPESTYENNVETSKLSDQLSTSESYEALTSAVTSGLSPPSSSLAEVYEPPATIPTTTIAEEEEEFRSAVSTVVMPIEVSMATTIENDEVRTVLLPETTETTNRYSLTTTIMDKLSGGAKTMLVQLLGGILTGGQPQNFKDKTEKQLLEKNILEISSPSIGATDSPNSPSYKFPSYFNPPQNSHTTVISGEDTGFVSSLEVTLPPTEVRTSGEHPLIAVATSLSPPLKVTDTASSTTPCQNCDQSREEEERAPTSGWRPLQWPAFWSKRPPSQQRPPSPPATLHNWLHTSWNNNNNSLNHNKTQQRNPMSSTSKSDPMLNTESEEPSIPTSTSIPRLPSSFLEEHREVTPSTNISNGSQLLLVDWLLGASQNTDPENINNTLINKQNLTESAKHENETLDELQSKEVLVDKSNVSRDWSLVSNNEFTGRKNEISDQSSGNANIDDGQGIKNKNHKEEMANVESVIQEMKKVYEKLRLGIPTPFHIFRHLKTRFPHLKQIKTILKQ